MLAKLKAVESSIKYEEDNLARIPSSLTEQKKLMSNLSFKLQDNKTKKKTIVPGTAEEDERQIV